MNFLREVIGKATGRTDAEWLKRAKQAVVALDKQEKTEIVEARRSREEEIRRSRQEAVENRSRAKEEAKRFKETERRLLKDFGAKELLEQVRRDVWKGGEIKIATDARESSFDVAISLEHHYTEGVRRSYHTGYPGGKGMSSSVLEKETRKDIISITLRSSTSDTSGDVLFLYSSGGEYYLNAETVRPEASGLDSAQIIERAGASDTARQFVEVGATDPTVQRKIKDFLAKDSMTRIEKHRLPRDLRNK